MLYHLFVLNVKKNILIIQNLKFTVSIKDSSETSSLESIIITYLNSTFSL